MIDLKGKFYFKRFRAWLWRWQEVVLWLPVSAAAVVVSYHLIPYVDPNSGLDGFGDIFNFLVQGLKVVMLLFVCWMFKRTYWYDIPRREEKRLYKEAAEGKHNHWLMIRDRLEWAVLIVLFGWLLIK